MKSHLLSLIARLEHTPLTAVSNDLAQQYEEKHRAWRESVIGVNTETFVRFNQGQSYRRDPLADGLATVRNIRRTLDSFVFGNGATRSELQKAMHEKMLMSVLHYIFGDEWLYSSHAIMAQLFPDDVSVVLPKRYMLFACPRRQGKTTGVAMFLAAFLKWAPPRTRIAAFSNTEAASRLLMDEVCFFAHQIDTSGWYRSERANRPTLFYSTRGIRDDPFASQLIVCPGSNSRGIGGQVIILEEAAYIDPGVIMETIAPLLQVRGTVLIGVSSANLDDENHFNAWVKAVDTDTKQPLFDVINIQTMCEACQNANKLSCEHLNTYEVKHIDPDASKVISVLMQASRDTYLAEMCGITTTKHMKLFEGRLLEGLASAPERRPLEHLTAAMVCIDPAGGGDASHSAVTVVSYTQDGCLLVSLLGKGGRSGRRCMPNSSTSAMANSVISHTTIVKPPLG